MLGRWRGGGGRGGPRSGLSRRRPDLALPLTGQNLRGEARPEFRGIAVPIVATPVPGGAYARMTLAGQAPAVGSRRKRSECRIEPTSADIPGSELPEEFLERLRRILPEALYAGCARTFYQASTTVFRVNPLRADTGRLADELRAAGFDLTALSWPEGFSVAAEQRRALTDCPACREGRLYIQNPASMVPALVLDPRPGERILDLCAAPGGKTLQLAGLMGNQGQISAVESVRPRFFRLRANLETHGATNVRTYLKDGRGVWRNCPEEFDRVLLDAPCSAEGRFNVAEPASHAYWSVRKIREMQRKQQRLLHSAAQCLRPGGVLVYATCTFAPEENEVVLNGLLRKLGGGFRIDEIELPVDRVQEGLTSWRGKELDPELSKAVRILPDGVMEGFFVCRLTKLASTLSSSPADETRSEAGR